MKLYGKEWRSKLNENKGLKDVTREGCHNCAARYHTRHPQKGRQIGESRAAAYDTLNLCVLKKKV